MILFFSSLVYLILAFSGELAMFLCSSLIDTCNNSLTKKISVKINRNILHSCLLLVIEQPVDVAESNNKELILHMHLFWYKLSAYE